MERFIQKFTEHVNIKKDDGFTPLHLSALNDHLDVLTALLESVSLSIYLVVVHADMPFNYMLCLGQIV